MYNRNYTYQNTLPGVFNIKLRKKKIQDFSFFLVLTALPTSFYAFASKDFLFDYRLVFVLLGHICLIINISNIKEFLKLPFSKYYILICLFILFKFYHSISVLNISSLEVIKVYRTNFHYPITTLGFLLYMCNFSKERIYRFFYWLINLVIILSVIYTLNVILKLNIYNFVIKGDSENYKLLGQNLAAVPRYLNVVLFLGTYSLFYTGIKNSKVYLMILCPLIIVSIIIVRNQLIVFLVLTFIVYILSLRKLNFTTNITLLFFTLVLVSFLGSFLNKNITAIKDKFESSGTITDQEFLSEGTYKFRLDLIADSYERISNNNSKFLGNGYQRESNVGEYDYVMGGDTLLASILYTEGLIGLSLRGGLLILLLIYGIKNFRHKEKKFSSILIISIIIPGLLNVVQTKLLTNYSTTILIIFVLFYYERLLYSKANVLK